MHNALVQHLCFRGASWQHDGHLRFCFRSAAALAESRSPATVKIPPTTAQTWLDVRESTLNLSARICISLHIEGKPWSIWKAVPLASSLDYEVRETLLRGLRNEESLAKKKDKKVESR